MKAETEIWQVMTQGEVFQADLPTLKQWVAEGAVLPQDLVRKGSLKWIEAAKAPALRAVFTGHEIVEPAPPQVAPEPFAVSFSASEPSAPPSTFSHSIQHSAPPPAQTLANTPEDEETYARTSNATPSPGHCDPAHYPAHICRVCGSTFCRECVKFAESTLITICAVCGDLCRPYDEVRMAQAKHAFQASGFGFEDLGHALLYPFKHKISLLFGAGLYGVLLLAGYRGQILAWAILFGCLSLVINRVAYGKLDQDFMPDFSSFSPWDDVVVPLRLGIGVTVITIGPTVLVVIALFMGWFGGGATSTNSEPDVVRTMEEMQAAQVGRAKFDPSQPGVIQPVGQSGGITAEDMHVLINGSDPKREAEVRRKIQGMTPTGQVAEQIEKASKEATISQRLLNQFLAHPGLIAISLLVAVGWGVFYYPMAIAVAGYTEDFWAVVNPFVGLDTIRRMGLVYAKAFVMYVVVQVVGLIFSIPIAIVTSPFTLPLVGNLPATVIDGMVAFYINLVIACILGLAIFKSADRLGIEVR